MERGATNSLSCQTSHWLVSVVTRPTTPWGAQGGDCSMTEHAPGFTILPHFFLFCDIRDTAWGLGSGRDTVSDTPESESTLHCLLPDFGNAKIKWGAETYPVRVSVRIKWSRTDKVSSTVPNTSKPPSQDFLLTNTGSLAEADGKPSLSDLESWLGDTMLSGWVGPTLALRMTWKACCCALSCAPTQSSVISQV